jgi:hypothetical protein
MQLELRSPKVPCVKSCSLNFLSLTIHVSHEPNAISLFRLYKAKELERALEEIFNRAVT